MEYRNVFKEFGYSQKEIDEKLENAFNTVFYGTDEERFYYPAGDDMGYMVDTGNIDVRTEGMSYGMMICLQLDKKEEFDRIWKWAKTYMFMNEGYGAGYFAWSCATDGTPNANGAAPDGEEFFAMDLILASHRWGDGEGIYNYSKEAVELLQRMIHHDSPMFDPENHYIKFVTNCGFTDPSYHLPHFYEMYAAELRKAYEKTKDAAYLEDAAFYDKAAVESRKYFKLCCNPETGMNPEYANFDGTPNIGFSLEWGRHDYFFSDAYRTAANMGLDYSWCVAKGSQPDEFEKEITAKLRKFYEDKNMPDSDGPHYYVYEVNGKQVPKTDDSDNATGGRVLHPYALIATNAMSYLATDAAVGDNGPGAYAVRLFWDLPLRTGVRRYYDNCLYLFALLALSGNYRMY